MNIMGTLNGVLAQLRPFVAFVALVFGVLAAWKGLAEIVPVLNQIWSPRGDGQRLAVIGAALALVAGRA
jgi:hypothetical protein